MNSRGGKAIGSGKLARRLALVCTLAAAVSGVATVVIALQALEAALGAKQAVALQRGWVFGLAAAACAALAIGIVAYVQGAKLGSRLTELALGLAKIGRGPVGVRIRYSGRDEIARLGRGLQYLADDLAAMAREAEHSGGLGANADPLVREMRDQALPRELPAVEGFEVDAAIGAGTRGGLEYFDAVVKDGQATLLVVSPEGAGAVAALAARLARDELVGALQAGATARKALQQANRALHQRLPRSACAKACLLALAADEVKAYQAGYRPPLLVCRAGKVAPEHGEGLALGLDQGPVFDQSLRAVAVPVAQGVRLVVANEAAHRIEDFTALVARHAPKHTTPFLHLVIGALQNGAGEAGLREDVVLLTAKRW